MFVICSHCSRHHRHDEPGCPFCGSNKPTVTRRFGVGLAIAVGVTASFGCGGEESEPAAAGGTISTDSGASGGTIATGGTTNNTSRGGVSALGGAYAAAPGGTPSTMGGVPAATGMGGAGAQATGGSKPTGSGGRTGVVCGSSVCAPDQVCRCGVTCDIGGGTFVCTGGSAS